MLQQIGSISLVCGLVLRGRWIPSEKNIADGPSRGQIAPGAYCKECQVKPSKAKQPSCEGQVHEPSECSRQNLGGETDERRAFEETKAEVHAEDCGTRHDSAASSQEVSEVSDKLASDLPRPGWEVGPKSAALSAGKEECERGGSVSVPEILSTLRGLLQGERRSLATQLGQFGSAASRLHGSHVPSGKGSARRGEDPRINRVQLHGSKRKTSEIAKGTQGVAESGSCFEPPASSKGCYVRDSDESPGCRTSRHGVVDVGGFLPVLETRGGDRDQGRQRDRASEVSRGPVPICTVGCQGARRRTTRQSRCVRQLHSFRPAGHSLGGGSTAVARQEVAKEGCPSVHLHYGPVSKTILESSKPPGAEQSSSLPVEAWRSHRRYDFRCSRPQQHQGQGQVAYRPKRTTLRKGGTGATVAQQDLKQGSSVLQDSREELAQSFLGTDHRPIQSPVNTGPDVFTMKHRPRRFCLELFAGTARISEMLNKQGTHCFPIDTCLFPSHNVLDPKVANNILNFISSHRVMMVLLGMPCTTFSRARRWDGLGPPPLRTSKYIWGLPGLRRAHQSKLVDGNNLFLFTMRVLKLCQSLHIPYILENPLTSMAWDMPPLLDFCSSFSPYECELDFCCYGEGWKKPTKLLYNFMDLSSLALRCQGTHLRCSNTKRPHRALTGTDSAGVFWTLRAQPYPWQLCSAFADLAAIALRDSAVSKG